MDRRGRWAVETYLGAWERLCDTAWRRELEDPLFARAAALAVEDEHGPTEDAPWLEREAWRDIVRSWWFAARGHYASPDEIPLAWMLEQRERDADGYPGIMIAWEPDRESWVEPDIAAAAYTARQDETWALMRALIATEQFWPLHLDTERAARAQFDTLRQWAPSALSAGADASWWRAQA
jgi:hypothetical protein